LRVELAVEAIRGLRELGFHAVTDLTPYGMLGRDPAALREISERSGIHVIAGAATYLEPYTPEWALQADIEEMRKAFVREATVGFEDTGIKIGILGEQATGLDVITPHEEKCLRAAVRAHHDTGLAISTHTTHGTMALEQLEILRQEGADLRRVIIGHMDIQPDTDYVRRVLDSGVNVAFDTFGKQFWDLVLVPLPADLPEGEFSKRAYLRPDDARLAQLASIVAHGYASQLLLSMDMTGHAVYLNPVTHGQLGYSFLGRVILPSLLALGVPADAIEQMVRHNPARLLTVG
jgi:predicted metal-dependent phosphotriesterase family hydrolase